MNDYTNTINAFYFCRLIYCSGSKDNSQMVSPTVKEYNPIMCFVVLSAVEKC